MSASFHERQQLGRCRQCGGLSFVLDARIAWVALARLQGFRHAHREYLLRLAENDLANLSLDWLSEKWERAVFPHGRDSRMLYRRFFELGVFSQIMRELNSGDLDVEGSDRLDDDRVHLVSDEELQRELPRYCEIVGLENVRHEQVRVLARA